MTPRPSSRASSSKSCSLSLKAFRNGVLSFREIEGCPGGFWLDLEIWGVENRYCLMCFRLCCGVNLELDLHRCESRSFPFGLFWCDSSLSLLFEGVLSRFPAAFFYCVEFPLALRFWTTRFSSRFALKVLSWPLPSWSLLTFSKTTIDSQLSYTSPQLFPLI